MKRNPSTLLLGPKVIVLLAVALLSSMAMASVSAASQADESQGQDAGSSQGGASHYTMGLEDIPPGLQRGDAYENATVIDVNRKIGFVEVMTDNPERFKKEAQERRGVGSIVADPARRFLPEQGPYSSSSTSDDGSATVNSETSGSPHDPRIRDQYGPQQIRADKVWETTVGDGDAAVCIVDTGLRYTHEDLGAQYVGGYDFVNNDDDPWDDNGHGTVVSGIAAAVIDNGVGIAGIGNVNLYAVKVLDSDGTGWASDVADGITWCADNTPQPTVISLSLGASDADPWIEEAVDYAYAEKGKLIAAGNGNDGPCTDCVLYPASYPRAIAVACTNEDETQCDFSSQGPETGLAAPGELVLSTYDEDDSSYVRVSGTSMSTPHVSGAAALVWSCHTEQTNTQLRAALNTSAQDLGPTGKDNVYGYGEVDALGLLDTVGCTEPRVVSRPPNFSEDFDDGVADGWVLNGLWNTTDTCKTSANESNHLGYMQDGSCDYDTGEPTNGSARFAVNLSNATSAQLNLQNRWGVENARAGYDEMRVEVSTDDGASWQTLRARDSSDSNQTFWTNASFDLDPYVGHVVQVRFSFDSLDSSYNSHDGWRLDNVQVEADVGPTLQSYPYTESFDDGAADGWVLNGLWHTTDACETPTSSPNVLGAMRDDTCDYATGNRVQDWAHFAVDLTQADHPVLDFQERWQVEEEATTYDRMTLEVSTDEGASWQTLRSRDSGDADQTSWNDTVFGLTGYAGQAVDIRYHFDSVDSIYNDYEGWRLDDVSVVENDPPKSCFEASPQKGTLITSYWFDAGCTTEDYTPPLGEVEYRWDFEDDGIWDTGWRTQEQASQRYDSLGEKTIRLEARDSFEEARTTTRTVTVCAVHEFLATGTCVVPS